MFYASGVPKHFTSEVKGQNFTRTSRFVHCLFWAVLHEASLIAWTCFELDLLKHLETSWNMQLKHVETYSAQVQTCWNMLSSVCPKAVPTCSNAFKWPKASRVSQWVSSARLNSQHQSQNPHSSSLTTTRRVATACPVVWTEMNRGFGQIGSEMFRVSSCLMFFVPGQTMRRARVLAREYCPHIGRCPRSRLLPYCNDVSWCFMMFQDVWIHTHIIHIYKLY